VSVRLSATPSFAPRGVDEARDPVEGAGVAGAGECLAQRLAAGAFVQNRFEQAEEDELLAGDGDVRPARVVGVVAENPEGLVDGARAADDDQRAALGVDAPSVADQRVARVGVHAHARDQEQVGDSTIELHLRRPEALVPLLEDEAGLVEPGVGQRRADGADASRRHAGVGVDEREHARPVVEGAGGDGDEVMARRDGAQPIAKGRHRSGLQQLIATSAAWKFHVGAPLCTGATPYGRA